MARPWYRRRWLQVAGAAVVLVLVGQHSGSGSDQGTPSASPTSAAPATPASSPSKSGRPRPRKPHPRTSPALTLLASLPTKGRAPKTGYEREQFGQAWLDADRNGCDTRNDVLRRDLHPAQIRPGTNGCLVESGVLRDAYTATTIHFVRGDDSIDIDHVVALSDAWQTGAFRWEIRKRAAFANDPLNLLAVDSSANRQKGDGDAATWLPANRRSWCGYAARQVAVKAKYELWVTPPERAALERVLDGCPGEPAPTGAAPTLVPFPVADPGAGSGSDGTAGADGTSGSAGEVSYANCDEVRAAGAAPIHRGDPGYAAHLDRDGDGTGCE